MPEMFKIDKNLDSINPNYFGQNKWNILNYSPMILWQQLCLYQYISVETFDISNLI